MTRIVTALLLICLFSGCEKCPRKTNVIDLSRSNVATAIIEEAAEYWNYETGHEFFRLSNRGGNITINTVCELPNNWSGMADWTLNSQKILSHCEVYMLPMPLNSRTRVLKHELGHCLTLDDEYQNEEGYTGSIMHSGDEVMSWHLQHFDECLD